MPSPRISGSFQLEFGNDPTPRPAKGLTLRLVILAPLAVFISQCACLSAWRAQTYVIPTPSVPSACPANAPATKGPEGSSSPAPRQHRHAGQPRVNRGS